MKILQSQSHRDFLLAISFSKCFFLLLEAFLREELKLGHLPLNIKTEDNEYESRFGRLELKVCYI